MPNLPSHSSLLSTPRRRVAVGVLSGLVVAGLLIGAEAAQAATTRAVNATAKVTEVKKLPHDRSRYAGRATGAPFGSGAMTLVGRLVPANQRTNTPARIAASFTLATRKGVVKGSGSAPLKVRNGKFVFKGPAKITKGTGRYAGAKSVGITFSGSVSSLRELTVRLRGKVRY